MTFGVHLRDREAAEQALVDHSADLAVVFEPGSPDGFHDADQGAPTGSCRDGAGSSACCETTLRLSECMDYPISLPTTAYGVRHLLDIAMRITGVVSTRSSIRQFRIPAQSRGGGKHHHLPDPDRSVRRNLDWQTDLSPLDNRDVPAGILYLGQLKGRTLPRRRRALCVATHQRACEPFEVS